VATSISYFRLVALALAAMDWVKELLKTSSDCLRPTTATAPGAPPLFCLFSELAPDVASHMLIACVLKTTWR
jgi:hypothetical protein